MVFLLAASASELLHLRPDSKGVSLPSLLGRNSPGYVVAESETLFIPQSSSPLQLPSMYP
jgi:hypothetical protein